MNKEVIETIKKAGSADELKEIANKNGYALTLEEAQGYFDLYHNNGKISEEELDNVTGGSTCINNKHYSDDPHGFLIITYGNRCDGFVMDPAFGGLNDCYNCKFRKRTGEFVDYCTMRNRWNDPYNDKIGTKDEIGPNGKYWDDNGDPWY